MTGISRQQVLATVRSRLEAEGFRRVDRDEIYLLNLDDDAKGWLSLSSDMENGAVEISPKVGVRHERLHAAVDKLLERAAGTEPSVSRLLGYLMPQQSANLVWRFESSETLDTQARDLVAAIVTTGRPFMAAHADLEQLIDSLRDAVPWEYSQMRIPVALALLGRREEAEDFVRDELAKARSRTDPAAETFREFARRFELADAV